MLYEKLHTLKTRVNTLVKDTEGHGYDYVSGHQILSQIKPILDELKLLLIPSVSEGTHYEYEYTTSNGVDKKETIIYGPMQYIWVDTESPDDKPVIPWAYYGQMSDVSKAFGAALTYSERYFLLKFLGVPTDEDDPDTKDTTDRKPANAHKSKGSSGSSGPRRITEPQQKRLIAIAKGDMKLINELLQNHNVSDITQISMGEQYDKICDDAAIAKASEE